ncbi:MAG: SsrA-binding protein SmpB [Bacteroidetes bacterium]|nr:MAG: SsrA-binding protein SmpB [Bacteroidota bacterium]
MSNQNQAEDRIVVVTNRKARYDYFIEDTFETGIALKGTEVKSLRESQANLQDSYALIRDGELWLIGMHINPFDKGNINNHDPKRDRKLLVHKRELRRLQARVIEKGLTLIPVTVYFTHNIAKIELAIARGKKSHDKRESIAKRDAERELRRKDFD